MPIYVSKTYELDLNQILVSTNDTRDFSQCTWLSVDIRMKSGLWGASRLVFECSADKTNWTGMTTKAGGAILLSAVGLYMDIEDFRVGHFRIRPTIASGAAAIATITLNGKG